MHVILSYNAVLKKSKISNKSGTFSDIRGNLVSSVYIKMQLNIKFKAISSISFCASSVTTFASHTDRPTVRHFVKIVKLILVHPKTYKSVINQKSKMLTILVLFSYIEYKRKLIFSSCYGFFMASVL